jgi:hypothetical protein
MLMCMHSDTIGDAGRSAHVADSLQGPRQTLEFNISKDAVSSRLKRRPSIEEVKDQGIIIGELFLHSA